ncbi:MAG: hypothetical protein ACU84J_13065, partial [Gammaproteobacteria bacterium]
MIKFKPLVLAIGLCAAAGSVFAGLHSPRTVVDNHGPDRIRAFVKFNQPVSGDLYIATMLNGQLYFLDGTGQFTTDLVPFIQSGEFSGDLPVLDVGAAGLP